MKESAVDAENAVLAHQQAAKVLQPSERAFHLPAFFVATQLAAILPPPPFSVSAMRHQQFNPAPLQALAQRVGIVSPVRDDAPWLAARTTSSPARNSYLRERAFRECDLCRRSARQLRSQWNPLAIDQYHPLRALAPLGFANSSAPFFADTKLPSRNVSSQSSSWSWFSAANIALQAWSQTPCSSHCRNLRQQVGPLGYSEGRSRHRAPVRSTHRMPSTHSRFEAQGRPRLSRRRFGAGKKYSINAHCRSLSRMLPAQPIPAPIGKCLP